MRVLTASDRAVLVECADLDEAMRMHRAWADVPGVIERVPGARTVLVRFDPLVTSAAELASALSATRADQVQLVAGPEVVVPVRYDGDDLADTARLLGVSVDELVRRHGVAHWTVAFSGFAPGFGYLVGDDPLFDVPRRPSPRTRVPAGSVALAGRFSGVYPRETPGGWQLIGTTDAVMWDVHRDPPALLVPGARVRFVTADRVAVSAARSAVVSGTSDASAAERSVGVRHADAGPNGPPVPAPALEVLNPALQLLVQDRGRPGLAALGVPASGAADRIAMRDANRAVGNAPEAAVLEGIGPSAVRFHGAGVAVITGAEGELAVTGADGATRRIGHGVPFAVADGDELHIGAPMCGLRFTIAVRGGIRMPAELGSCSTDILSGIGPAPLRAGDMVPLGDAAPNAVEPAPLPRELPAAGGLFVLDITLGPRRDWFTATAVRLLGEQEWTVTARSDRVGMRLHGERPLERAINDELPSEGAVDGAIQVTSDGQPVVFGPDHPTTGGYPIIGALTDAARDLAAQLSPGVRIRFRVAT